MVRVLLFSRTKSVDIDQRLGRYLDNSIVMGSEGSIDLRLLVPTNSSMVSVMTVKGLRSDHHILVVERVSKDEIQVKTYACRAWDCQCSRITGSLIANPNASWMGR